MFTEVMATPVRPYIYCWQTMIIFLTVARKVFEFQILKHFLKSSSSKTPWAIFVIARSSHSEVFIRKSVLKICSKFIGGHPCRSVISIKLLKQLYWNRTSTWVFSCKFAAYFQNTFSYEYLWVATSEANDMCKTKLHDAIRNYYEKIWAMAGFLVASLNQYRAL